MTRWNKMELFEGRSMIVPSVLRGEVRKRVVGVGLLVVRPVPNWQVPESQRAYVESRGWPTQHICRDEAVCHVTHAFAQHKNGMLEREIREELAKVLNLLQSTAYGVVLKYRGREFRTVYPHS